MHACLNAIVKHDVDRDGRVDRYHCRTLIDTTPEVLVSLPRTAIPTSNHGIHDELGRLHPRPARHFVNTRIETVLDRDHVYLPRNSKQKRFQNWAKTFSCEPERGESILTVLVSAVAGGSSYVDRYSV
jgi:hypothetical protein